MGEDVGALGRIDGHWPGSGGVWSHSPRPDAAYVDQLLCFLESWRGTGWEGARADHLGMAWYSGERGEGHRADDLGWNPAPWLWKLRHIPFSFLR